MSNADEERHAMKMAKKKAARDKIMATKTNKKGLIIINTGKGKGKSSAAFGMIFRCIAHDMKCGVVQFIKGGMSTGERNLILSKFQATCEFHTMGEGFTWETQDKSRDTEMALSAWEKAKELIRDDRNKMILLDEKGKSYSSVEYAGFMQQQMNSGIKRLVFVVGGPYGFDASVYDKSAAKISFSKMTFSHQMIRLFFVEQIYRAMTILRNEPYHHE